MARPKLPGSCLTAGLLLGLAFSVQGPVAEPVTVADPRILLVDDDDNDPDVREAYEQALAANGLSADVWDTAHSDDEPGTAELEPYHVVIWFTGAAFRRAPGLENFAGPSAASETALAGYLDAGGCLLISSQDYLFDKGAEQTDGTFAPTPLMIGHLGVAAASNDVGQNTVTGAGPGPFETLGPFTLDYAFSNFSDRLAPDASAGTAFQGEEGIAALFKQTDAFFSVYLAFPFEALPEAASREVVMAAFLRRCGLARSLTFEPGLNLFSYPGVLPEGHAGCESLGAALGSATVSRVDPLTQTVETCSPTAPFALSVTEGYHIETTERVQLGFPQSATCEPVILRQGLNLVGFDGPEGGLRCHEALDRLRTRGVRTLQRLEPRRGRYESCTRDAAGALLGDDFLMRPGEGYLLYAELATGGLLPGCE